MAPSEEAGATKTCMQQGATPETAALADGLASGVGAVTGKKFGIASRTVFVGELQVSGATTTARRSNIRRISEADATKVNCLTDTATTCRVVAEARAASLRAKA